MKVLISGGWGYGNLGDDAILEATLELVRDSLPACHVTLFSYEPEETRESVRLDGSQVLVAPHRHLDLGASPRVFQHVRHRGSFSSRVSGRIRRIAAETRLRLGTRALDRAAARHAPTFRDADLLIQAGGGYFYGDWTTSAWAHGLELELATRGGTPSLVVGPSLGPFEDGALADYVLGALRGAAAILVRDETSRADLAAAGIEAMRIPDLALAVPGTARPAPDGPLGVVLKENAGPLLTPLAGALAVVAGPAGVRALTSRRWQSNQDSAAQFRDGLQARGVPVVVEHPRTVAELEARLAGCSTVVSQTMHGAILAARNGVPIVVLSIHAPGAADGRKLAGLADWLPEVEVPMIRAGQSEDSIKDVLRSAEGVGDSMVRAVRDAGARVRSAFMAAIRQLGLER